MCSILDDATHNYMIARYSHFGAIIESVRYLSFCKEWDVFGGDSKYGIFFCGCKIKIKI